MKAIQIPNAALLDVFGRPVAVNNHDLQRASVIHNPSFVGLDEKNSPHKVNGIQNNHSVVNHVSTKVDHAEQLTVIGKLKYSFQYSTVVHNSLQEKLHCISLFFIMI